MRQTGRTGIVGDGDPLDICVLTERPITHGAILVRARTIGGLCLLDKGEADDKIIAVLVDDPAYGAFRDLGDVPTALVDRLRHYFLTYKDIPDATTPRTCEIAAVYGVARAHEVVRASIADCEASSRRRRLRGDPVPVEAGTARHCGSFRPRPVRRRRAWHRAWKSLVLRVAS
jgi:inorganic pyrophosphatase